jgi:predicted nucleic acid-binding protein
VTDSDAARNILRVEAARMVQQPLNPAVLEAARQLLDGHELRFTEALQLGAAVVAREMFQGMTIVFVSADQRMLEIAKDERFETLNPVSQEV